MDTRDGKKKKTTSPSSKEGGWKSRILLEPKQYRDGFEINVIRCPKAFVREVKMVYPSTKLEGLVAVVTCQRAKHDLCEIGEDVAKEKDALLESFAEVAGQVVKQLKEDGEWADYIDPCSGLPATQDHANRGYSEVDGLAVLLHYATHSAGPRKVASHPIWGTKFYPATFFTTAPAALVLEALNEAFSS